MNRRGIVGIENEDCDGNDDFWSETDIVPGQTKAEEREA